MGRNGRFQKAYGKVIGEDKHDGRPGWKGPGYQKPKEKAKPKATTVKSNKAAVEEESEEGTASLIPLELQQSLLGIFRDVFSDVLNDDRLKERLQEVKGALFERDFEKAFGTKEYLEAYSVRWSPSRALCYQNILVDLQEHLADLLLIPKTDPREDSQRSSSRLVQVACFGGGAAEVIAFGGLIRHLLNSQSLPSISPSQNPVSDLESKDDETNTISQSLQETSLAPPHPSFTLKLLDVANWDNVVSKLNTGLLTPPTLSKYASASAKESNAPLLPSHIHSTSFHSLDALSLTQEQITSDFGREPMLLTLLFTLNELYTSSISKTTAFLLKLTIATKPGTLLLVVDSPGSYSETRIGNSTEGKRYPMKWLMDHTLLDTQRRKQKQESNDEEEESGVKGKGKRQEEEAAWEKVVEDDSRWFRIPEGLKYPIPLENMRYQIHLYRRL